MKATKDKIDAMRGIAYEKVTKPIDEQKKVFGAMADVIVRQSHIFGVPFFVLDLIICGICFINLIAPSSQTARLISFILLAIFAVSLPKDYRNWKRFREYSIQESQENVKVIKQRN